MIHPVALCMWREARGDGEDGMRAVGHVVANRALAWYAQYADPFHAAVYAKNQFTSMSDPNDPQYQRFPANVDPLWQFAMPRAVLIVDGQDYDLSLGALYYANLETMDQAGWFKHNIVEQPKLHPVLVKIGHQTFFA